MAAQPSTAPAQLSRPHLCEQLGDGLRAGAALLVAEAGFGKTTAVEQATTELGWPVAWVACTPADREPAQLLFSIASALRTVAPGVADVLAEELAAGSAGRPPFEVAREMVAEFERLMVDPLVIAIDDGEQLAGAGVSEQLVGELLRSDRERLALAVLTRRPLELKLARLKARGRLTELGGAELAFSADECATLIALDRGREPSPDELEHVMAATEGWPLGVALIARAAAAASLPERPARSEAFEFLAEEVLGRLDATLRAAVIESALPRELDTDICAGLGLPGGFPELAEREGLFLRPMDRERTRFRYHPLFRSFLLSRFESERDAAERGAAHRTAAAALLASGETTEAIEHWIAAAAWREAVDVVTRNDDALINFAPDRVGEWLTQMPADLRAEPATRYLEGRLHWATGHMEAALPPLREASQGFRVAGEHEHDWAARALLAEGLYLLGGWDELVQLAEGFDGHDAAGAPSAALLVALRATDVLRNTGRHDESNRILERVQAHPARSSVGGRLASELAFIDYEAGRVDDAIKRLERETRRAGREQPAAARASLALNFASILGEVGFEERSLAESERLIRIGRDDGLPRALRYAELHSGQWHSAAGRVKEATAALARAGVTDETHYDDYLATLIHAQLASARGEPTQAVALSEKALASISPATTTDHVSAALELSPVLAAAGEHERAARLVSETLARVDSLLPGEMGRYPRARLLARRAWLHWLAGDVSASDEALAEAWHWAGPALDHVIRPEWGRMRSLLWDALARGAIDAEATTRAIERAISDPSALIELTEHPLPRVRRLAVRSLIASAHPLALARLGDFGSDPDAEVAAAVAAAVEQLRAAPPPLAFSLLGDFAVRRGPWTLDPSVWQRPIAARLLRFLLLHREGPLPEDVIFEAFWPGKTPQAARHNLAVLVSQVRSALDIPGSSLSIIASADRTYLLDLGPEDSVDADEFDAAAAAALTMEGPERTGRLEHAAGLWHGEPLPQERYSEWTFAWRERLIDRYLQVLAALADGYLQAGDHGSAIRAGRAALALDPLNEAAHRSLMAAYARAGRIGHALRQYLECRRSLVDELGVEPSRATSALQARILGGAPV